MAILACVVVLIISACGTNSDEISDDRKFANDPVTEQSVIATVTEAVDVDATPVDREPVQSASPDTLLSSRGSPNTLYTLSDGTLLALNLREEETIPTVIALPEGQRVVDFDGSPNGDRVAVLMSATGDMSISLAFFESDGEQIGGVQPLVDHRATATPPGVEDVSAYNVNWSPQGTDVLVVGPSLVMSAKVGHEPKPVSVGEVDGTLLGAAWSPQGSRLMLHVVVGDGSQHVYVRDVVAKSTREVRVLSTAQGNGLDQLQWLPDGSGLVYVQGPIVDRVVLRGQLYVYVLGQESPRLIATSGQGGISSTITDSVVSPDGRSVAYVISIFDKSDWFYHSMWIRSLDGHMSYQVPYSTRGTVTDLSWVGRGLTWEQRPARNEPGDIVLLRQGLEPVIIFDTRSPLPGSTPAASPVGAGGATPVASPGATPAGTPAATPQ